MRRTYKTGQLCRQAEDDEESESPTTLNPATSRDLTSVVFQEQASLPETTTAQEILLLITSECLATTATYQFSTTVITSVGSTSIESATQYQVSDRGTTTPRGLASVDLERSTSTAVQEQRNSEIKLQHRQICEEYQKRMANNQTMVNARNAYNSIEHVTVQPVTADPNLIALEKAWKYTQRVQKEDQDRIKSIEEAKARMDTQLNRDSYNTRHTKEMKSRSAVIQPTTTPDCQKRTMPEVAFALLQNMETKNRYSMIPILRKL